MLSISFDVFYRQASPILNGGPLKVVLLGTSLKVSQRVTILASCITSGAVLMQYINLLFS